MRSGLRTLLLAVLALGPLLLVLWAGGRSSEVSAAPEGARALPGPDGVALVSHDGYRFTLERPPGRIVPATAGVVDLLTQLVEPDRVALLPAASFSFSRLARDPGPWADLPRFEGYGAERLLAAGADLVVAAGWQGPETTAALRRAGVPVLVLAVPESWQDVLDSLHLLAAAVGAEERAHAVEAALAPRLARLRSESRSGLSAVSYTNLGTGGWVAGAGTTADILFELIGLENAAARARLEGHREIDLEGLFALAPDVIVVGAAHAGEGIVSTRAYLESQPVLATLPALQRELVLTLPQELFTTASTELVRAAELLADELDRRLARRLAR